MVLRRSRGILLAALAFGGCGSGGAPSPDGAAEVDAAPYCGGFAMPNPAGLGLPNPASYTANGDGTITDAVTGLVWEASVDDTRYTTDEAAAHCAAKGDGWRVPARLELVSLVDFTIGAPGPTIDAVFKDTPSSTYWTSSLYYGDVGDTWYVGFDGGYSDYGIDNQSNLVRCVRAPAPTCVPRRYEAGAGVVIDHATGLTWQQPFDPDEYTWDDAIAFCKAWGGRLPTVKEAQTIIDDVKEAPAVDLGVFPGTPAASFWTSSEKAGGGGAAWYVDFFYGASDSDVAARQFRVRCVR